MSEITLGSDTNGETKQSGGNSGSIDEIVNNLDKVKDWLSENPQIAEAIGIKLPELDANGGNMDTQETDTNDTKKAYELLINVAESLSSQGYGDYSVNQVLNYAKNNPDEIKEQL